jgi:hypothetical protein
MTDRAPSKTAFDFNVKSNIMLNFSPNFGGGRLAAVKPDSSTKKVISTDSGSKVRSWANAVKRDINARIDSEEIKRLKINKVLLTISNFSSARRTSRLEENKNRKIRISRAFSKK